MLVLLYNIRIVSPLPSFSLAYIFKCLGILRVQLASSYHFRQILDVVGPIWLVQQEAETPE